MEVIRKKTGLFNEEYDAFRKAEKSAAEKLFEPDCAVKVVVAKHDITVYEQKTSGVEPTTISLKAGERFIVSYKGEYGGFLFAKIENLEKTRTKDFWFGSEGMRFSPYWSEPKCECELHIQNYQEFLDALEVDKKATAHLCKFNNDCYAIKEECSDHEEMPHFLGGMMMFMSVIAFISTLCFESSYAAILCCIIAACLLIIGYVVYKVGDLFDNIASAYQNHLFNKIDVQRGIKGIHEEITMKASKCRWKALTSCAAGLFVLALSAIPQFFI